jgi:hypothetical protein
VRLKDLNSSFLEEVAARLLWETPEQMMKGIGIEANDVVAVVLLSNAYELCNVVCFLT